jgi:hypothetical protein
MIADDFEQAAGSNRDFLEMLVLLHGAKLLKRYPRHCPPRPRRAYRVSRSRRCRSRCDPSERTYGRPCLQRWTAVSLWPGRPRYFAEKCEGATGSLATVASDRGPSHPRSTAHGSRLPAISRREPQVGVRDTTPHRALRTPQNRRTWCRGNLANARYRARVVNVDPPDLETGLAQVGKKSFRTECCHQRAAL